MRPRPARYAYRRGDGLVGDGYVPGYPTSTTRPPANAEFGSSLRLLWRKPRRRAVRDANTLMPERTAALGVAALPRERRGRLKLLLLAGCDLNAADYDARTALHLSAFEGNLHIVNELVKSDANLNVKDRWDGTPLADAVLQKLEATPDAGVLILQSPGNIYAFKPASVAKVLEQHPTVTCIAGHSIGGLWAAEFCKDLESAGQWPASGLDFFYMGVHGRGVSLKPFKQLPFRKMGWSYASEDVTFQRAAQGDSGAYLARTNAELPNGATIVWIAGGNHENYGAYGSPGPAQGLAYKDNRATIAPELQHEMVARAAIAESDDEGVPSLEASLHPSCDWLFRLFRLFALPHRPD